jgi:hypothetical protein
MGGLAQSVGDAIGGLFAGTIGAFAEAVRGAIYSVQASVPLPVFVGRVFVTLLAAAWSAAESGRSPRGRSWDDNCTALTRNADSRPYVLTVLSSHQHAHGRWSHLLRRHTPRAGACGAPVSSRAWISQGLLPSSPAAPPGLVPPPRVCSPSRG